MVFASGNAFWLESHFEDFLWLPAISTERVTALAVTRLIRIFLYSCLRILTIGLFPICSPQIHSSQIFVWHYILNK